MLVQLLFLLNLLAQIIERGTYLGASISILESKYLPPHACSQQLQPF